MKTWGSVITWCVGGSVLAILLVCGCGKQGSAHRQGVKPGAIVTNSVVRAYWELGDQDVLVQVGEFSLAKGDFEARIAEELSLQDVVDSNRKARSLTQKKTKAFQAQLLRPPTFSKLMVQSVLSQEAKAQGIMPSTDDLARASIAVERVCKKLKIPIEQYAANMKGGNAELERRVREHAGILALTRKQFGKGLEVSDEDAKRLGEALKERLAASQASNQVIRATLNGAKEVLKQCANLTSATASNEIAEIQAKLPAGVLFQGVVTSDAFHLESETAEALSRMLPGAWSPIVQLENKFEIYFLIKAEPGKTPDDATYTYACAVSPREEELVVPELNMLKATILKRKIHEIHDPWIQSLMVKWGVLFPNGVGFMDFQMAQSRVRDTVQASGSTHAPHPGHSEAEAKTGEEAHQP